MKSKTTQIENKSSSHQKAVPKTLCKFNTSAGIVSTLHPVLSLLNNKSEITKSPNPPRFSFGCMFKFVLSISFLPHTMNIFLLQYLSHLRRPKPCLNWLTLYGMLLLPDQLRHLFVAIHLSQAAWGVGRWRRRRWIGRLLLCLWLCVMISVIYGWYRFNNSRFRPRRDVYCLCLRIKLRLKFP